MSDKVKEWSEMIEILSLQGRLYLKFQQDYKPRCKTICKTGNDAREAHTNSKARCHSGSDLPYHVDSWFLKRLHCNCFIIA
jgi:hypothetical protein